MARLLTAGAEFGHAHAEGLTTTGAGATVQASTARTGSRRFQTTGAASTWFGRTLAHVVDRRYWVRDYVAFSSLAPGANPSLILGTVASTWLEARLALVGGQPAITLTDATGATASWVFGANLSTGTYYRFELSYRYSATAGNRVAELKVWAADDVTLLATITIAAPGLGATVPTAVFFGHDSGTAPTVASTLSHDDIAINDDQGVEQNGSPGAGAVYVLRPIADPGTSTAGWTKPGGSTADRHTSVDNTPPVFEAYDANATSAEDYLRNALSTTPNNLDVDVQSYDEAGVPADDDVVLVQPILQTGSSSATDTLGTYGLQSNPAIAQASLNGGNGAAANAFDNGVASATPTTWPLHRGAVVYGPVVARATRPRFRVVKSTSTTRVAIVNAIGLLVEAAPQTGRSTRFVGTDRVRFPDAAALDALSLTKYLLLAWVKPTAGGHNNGRIFERGDTSAGATSHLQLMVGNGANGTRVGNFTLRQKTAGGAGVAVSPENGVPNGEWSLVGGHYDESLAGSRIRLFEGGVVVAPLQSVDAVGAIDVEAEHDVYVGNNGAADRGYSGLIAVVAVWDVDGLSTGEVDAIVTAFYAGGAGADVTVPEQGRLVELLRLGEATDHVGDLAVLTGAVLTGTAYSTDPAPVTYAELSSGGTVGVDLAASYAVRALEQQDLAAAYAVRVLEGQDLAAAYAVRQLVLEDLVASYAVVGSVSRDLAASYAVRALEAQDLAAAYAVRVLAARDVAASYAVRQLVLEDLAASYSVVAFAGRSLAAEYVVRALAADDLAAAYAVRVLAARDVAASYAVRVLEQQDLAAAYAVRVLAARDVAAAYSVAQLAAADLAAVYAVAEQGVVGRLLSASYAVRALEAQDLAASYAVRVAAARDMAASYAVRRLELQDLAAAYAVRVLTARDLAAAYAVRGFVDADLAASYVVVAHTGTLLVAVYDVLELIGVDLVAEYRIRELGVAGPPVTRRTGAVVLDGSGAAVGRAGASGVRVLSAATLAAVSGAGVTLANVDREGRTDA